MTIKYTFLLFALSLGVGAANASETSDSVSAQTDSLRREVKLSEVVVKARSATVVKDGISYVPAATAKKVAFDVTDLLRRMPISNIDVSLSGTVTNTFKDNAVFFVNGKKASELEIKSLLPKDVKRVLVLESPSDPKYRNERFVVDYITEPAYGGYVILNPSYTFFRNGGWYEALGKVVTGKSTFMAKANFRHADRKGGYSNRTEHYDLTDIKTGEKLDLTRKASYFDRISRTRYWDAAAEWRYDVSENEYHGVSVQYLQNKTPVTSYHGLVEDERIFSRSSSKGNNVGISYNFYRRFQKGSALGADILAGYNNAKASSSYINEAYTPIYNSHDENVYWWYATIDYSQPLGHNNSLAVTAVASNNYYTVKYQGSNNQKTRTREGIYEIYLYYNQNFQHGENRFNLTGDLDFPIKELQQKDGRHVTSVDYNVSVNFNSYFGDSHTLGFRIRGQQTGRNIAAFSGVTIQETELTGKTGNNRIKPSSMYNLQTTYTWLATRSFSLTVAAFYFHEMDVLCTRYFLYDGIVYTQSVNSGISSRGGVSAVAALHFLDNRLMAKAGGGVYKDYANGLFNYNKWDATAYVQLSYMHPKGFSAMIIYYPRKGTVPGKSMMTRDFQHYFYVNAGYAVGNFKAMVHCQPLYKFTHARNYIEREGVSIIEDDHTGLARYLTIDLKYVFDFGKRQSHNENIRNAARGATSL